MGSTGCLHGEAAGELLQLKRICIGLPGSSRWEPSESSSELESESLSSCVCKQLKGESTHCWKARDSRIANVRACFARLNGVASSHFPRILPPLDKKFFLHLQLNAIYCHTIAHGFQHVNRPVRGTLLTSFCHCKVTKRISFCAFAALSFTFFWKSPSLSCSVCLVCNSCRRALVHVNPWAKMHDSLPTHALRCTVPAVKNLEVPVTVLGIGLLNVSVGIANAFKKRTRCHHEYI